MLRNGFDGHTQDPHLTQRQLEAAHSVVGVNSKAGNARWFEHADPLSHSGSTLSTRQPVGTDGQWQGWTGIG